MPCSLHVGLEGSDGKHSHGNKLFMPSRYSRWWVPVLLIKSVLNNYLELSYSCLIGRVVPDQNSIKLRFSYLEIWLAWSIHVWKLFRHFSRIYCQVVICILKLSVQKTKKQSDLLHQHQKNITLFWKFIAQTCSITNMLLHAQVELFMWLLKVQSWYVGCT